MAFHIEIETNIDDASLDVESCEEVITFLENSYENVRAEIYSYCLGMRTLRYALISIVVLGILFFISHSKLFLIGMPIVTLLIMFGTISLAETTSVKAFMKIRKQHPEKTIPVCYYLYSLEGALLDLHWNDIPPKLKEELKSKIDRLNASD